MVRLRSTPSRPLAQNTQPIAQPTCVLMQIVRRSSSRSSTHSIWPPSASSNSSFSVPSADCRCLRDLARPKLKLGRQLRPQRLGQIGHRLEALGPALEDPLADLRSAKRRLAALGEPGFQRFPGLRFEQVPHSCIIQPTCRSYPSVLRRTMTNRKPPAEAPIRSLPNRPQSGPRPAARPGADGHSRQERRRSARWPSTSAESCWPPARRPSAIVTDNAHKHALIKGNTGNLIFKLPGTDQRRRGGCSRPTWTPCRSASARSRRSKASSSARRIPTRGLGADDRAGAAAMLTAALEILERKLPHPPLTFCWFIQEEVGLYGARLRAEEPARQAGDVLQLGRRSGRKGDDRRDGRLPDGDRRRRPGQPRRRLSRSGASARSRSPRWPSPTWPAAAGTA